MRNRNVSGFTNEEKSEKTRFSFLLKKRYEMENWNYKSSRSFLLTFLLKWTFNCFSKFHLDCCHKRFHLTVLKLHLKWQFSVTNSWNLFSWIEMMKFEYFVRKHCKKGLALKDIFFFSVTLMRGANLSYFLGKCSV